MRVEKFNANASKKVSVLISENYATISYNQIQKIIRNKDVKVCGKRISTDVQVSVGDEICFYINESVCEKKVDILYDMSRRKRKSKIITAIASILLGVLVVGVGFYLFSDESPVVQGDVTEGSLDAPIITLDGDTLTITSGSGVYSGFYIYANGSFVETTSALTVGLSAVLEDYVSGSYSIKVRGYNSKGTLSEYSNTVTYEKIPVAVTAPTISLDGDILTVCCDENTRWFYLYFNGDDCGLVFTPDDSGCNAVNIKGLFAGKEAGTYTVTAEAWGYGLETSAVSDAVTYVYDGSVEVEGTRAVGIGVIDGGEAEFSARQGTAYCQRYVLVFGR